MENVSSDRGNTSLPLNEVNPILSKRIGTKINQDSLSHGSSPHLLSSSLSENSRSFEKFRDEPVDDESSGDGDRSSQYDGSAASDYEEDLDLTGPSLQELMYGMSSYHVIVGPVSITMILSALASVTIKQQGTIQSVWNVGDGGNGNDSWGKILALSLGSTFLFVCYIGLLTFGIVLLYKYRCMKFLIGYMVCSFAFLLGYFGNTFLSIFIDMNRIPIDVGTYYISLYNIAVLGIVAVFYQKGIPVAVSQTFLIIISCLVAWNLSSVFDEWTAWCLLVMLALYDLCAVLTPWGPLRLLVNLMQEDEAPEMPGLLYEARLPSGVGLDRRKGRDRGGHTNESESIDPRAADIKANLPDDMKAEKNVATDIIATSLLVHASSTDNRMSSAIVPMAIAKLYRLPLLSHLPNGKTPLDKSSCHRGGSEPLLQDAENTSLPEGGVVSYYSRKFSTSELRSKVTVALPPNGGRIEIRSKNRYDVLGRDGEIRRTLEIDRRGRVFEILDGDSDDDCSSVEDDKSNTIRLGLGDFIFYSMLVSKAALFGFTTFAACSLTILAGLGGTLILLAFYQSALPALPISIFFAVTFYLCTRFFIVPWLEVIISQPFYV